MILLTALVFGVMAGLFVLVAFSGESSRPAVTPQSHPSHVAGLCTPTRYDTMTSGRYSLGDDGDHAGDQVEPTRQRRPQSPAKTKPFPPIIVTDWPMPKVEEEEPVAVPLATGRAARFASLEIRTKGKPIP